jgi:hypothetical protein
VTNGADGPTFAIISSIEMNDRLAQYRTAIVALLAMVKREGGFMSWDDQMLLKEIERLVDAK